MTRRGRGFLSEACARHHEALRRSFDETFFERVRVEGECWLWTGRIQSPSRSSTGGYGIFIRHGRQVFAHRHAYELAVGPIPSGLELMHSCDNRACVRPDHLSPGTHAENATDMAAKDRGRRGWLDEQTVAAIQADTGFHTAVAKRHSVSETTVRRIRNATYRPKAVA